MPAKDTPNSVSQKQNIPSAISAMWSKLLEFIAKMVNDFDTGDLISAFFRLWVIGIVILAFIFVVTLLALKIPGADSSGKWLLPCIVSGLGFYFIIYPLILLIMYIIRPPQNKAFAPSHEQRAKAIGLKPIA